MPERFPGDRGTSGVGYRCATARRAGACRPAATRRCVRAGARQPTLTTAAPAHPQCSPSSSGPLTHTQRRSWSCWGSPGSEGDVRTRVAAQEPRCGTSFLVGICCVMTVGAMRRREPAAKPPRSCLSGCSTPLRESAQRSAPVDPGRCPPGAGHPGYRRRPALWG